MGTVAASFFSLGGKASIEVLSRLPSSSPYFSSRSSRFPKYAASAQASRYSVTVSKGPPSPGRGPISQVPSSDRARLPIFGKVIDENSAFRIVSVFH